MEKKYCYITTTLPYVNSNPHIGFAMEIIRADIIARYKQLCGYEVFFNTGTDEHGQKIFQKAQEEGIDTQAYVDKFAERFKGLAELLGLAMVDGGIKENVSGTGIVPIKSNFLRTTDPSHVKAAQEFWKRCETAGYIYKKNYAVKYCVGCELEKTDSELENGRCSLHQDRDLEIREEENYFFKFSQFGEKLLALYADSSRPNFVVPDSRFNEIKSFVERGLEDFSISRLASKMSWGVPVPGDKDHVMYVWFDALVSYISTLGWPDAQGVMDGDFEKFWNQSGGVIQYCGKDNLRQQSAMWQAMLMACGLKPSRQIVIDGFIMSGGKKMSKSLGNVIDPYEVIAQYGGADLTIGAKGTEALRYFVAKELHPFEDSDFTMDAFKEAYNAKLANGVGNLLSRIMKMATGNDIKLDASAEVFKFSITSYYPVGDESKPVSFPNTNDKQLIMYYRSAFENYKINEACEIIWSQALMLDKRIQEKQPFKLIKTDREAGKVEIELLLSDLYKVGVLLQPIMPQTAKVIMDCVREGVMPKESLFMRKD